jgi:hypothetical protein
MFHVEHFSTWVSKEGDSDVGEVETGSSVGEGFVVVD